ncbi:hypothetical protein GCM10023115_04010 [Pontixanthobacter gangjinensis]|uniref:Uncharacterized protein n=1 Tax=Pontixanthobacter gangjinensis TaxID=1028742 RepID=A0A6I4SJ90_9SPHN|nr:hypothetical protein [Pontixanthobacter gangjinensis]MXO55654.1 hypothetical protein [Pontixanthobacter gangjinensis]
MKRIFAAALLASAITAGSPLAAQDGAGDKVNMVIIYGDDACPESTETEITVCARKAEGERFRIPEELRQSDSGENVAWAQRVESFETIGASGTLSCSPTGAGGITGCTDAMIKAAYAEKANSSSVRFGQLIEDARAERLSTIDADAADEQERVEVIEKEYMERLERERAAELPDEANPDAEALPAPNTIGPKTSDDE